MATFDINTTDDDILKKFGSHASGKTLLITGSSKEGIGAKVAVCLASASAKLPVLAGQNKNTVNPVVEEIQKANPSVQVEFVALDLLSNASVGKAVESVKSITEHLDYLVNNAGVMATRQFITSVEGVESQFASNYLGHFLLTNLLIQQKVITQGSMILDVGSLGYQMADIQFDDINYSEGALYNGWKAYGQANSAQLLGTRALTRRLKDCGIAVLIAYPGGKPLLPQNLVTLKQCAGVVLYTLLSLELRNASGSFIVENQIYKKNRDYANNDPDAEKLWELSEKLIGEKFDL